MPIELRHLQHAEAVAEHHSFVRAAEALGLTQPALSRSIQALEEELGVRLFDRHRKGVQPTAYGRILLRHARRLLNQARDLTREIDLTRGLDVGELTVGAGPIVAAGILPIAVGALCDAHPRLHVRVIIDSWTLLVEALRSSAIELFCADTREIDACTDLEIRSLPARPGGFVCRRGHPLARRKQVALEEILEYPLATIRLPDSVKEVVFGDELRRLLRHSDLAAGTIECESIPFARQLVLSSNAFSLVPYAVVEDDLAAGRLRKIPYETDESTHYGIVSLRGARLSPAAELLVSEIAAADAKLSHGDGQTSTSDDPS